MKHPESTLESERLHLRAPTASDVPQLARYMKRNREHFAESGPRNDAAFTEEFWSKKVVELARAETQDISVHRLLFRKGEANGDIVGRCAVTAIHRGPMQAAYLGYNLDEHSIGKGLMEEALRSVIPYMFGPRNLHRIMANYMPSNTPSAALLKRLGFVEEGLAKDYLRINGRWRDHVLTSLTNDDWSFE